MAPLKAPFPYFGGKSRVASLVWDRFGDVPNYCESFAGSLAVLLGRPHSPRTETVNDLDCHLSNFWRALQADPEGVASHCDWPVNEIDLAARRVWCFGNQEFEVKMRNDPEYYEVKRAAWWCWGICGTIGNGWQPNSTHLGDAGQGIHRKLPHLGDAGQGIHRKLPHLGDAGRGIHDYLCALCDRLRRVRVCCGDWSRVLGPSVTFKHGITGVFLDPPYTSKCSTKVYTNNDTDVAHSVREWALENSNNPLLRIALCGYEGEHNIPDTWECVEWKARGGYGSQGDGQGRDNAARERIWFSPHCLKPNEGKQEELF